ncbi:MAG: UDP-N-acetylmuramoyl-L-alanyl-D-glutamate--2,6-diaminopimelate ligase [Verrucomicrobiota bacterium]|nr:UDP-N-acetylmuramoyl-L-alanyl-D-glutamate--2,6-diaminopimelate ligase [Verrucomicrobiota bacterium]
MSIDLHSLFQGLPIIQMTGDSKTTITSLSIDSRRVASGSLFFALGGLRTDGNKYIDEAVHHGAVAIVSESPLWVPPRVALIQVESIRDVLAEVSRRFYGNPQRSLDLYGVTGTNGKTTVSTLLKHFLEEPGAPVGLLGTVAYVIGGRTLPSYRTTPEAPDIYGLLAQMRNAGCHAGVMEVSSHGIDQHRVQQLPFKTVAFTNLTQDHLDYHKTMESYFEVKSRIFTGATGLLPESVVINVDDEYGRRLLGMIPAGVRVITYGIEKDADFRATQVVMRQEGTRFNLQLKNGTSLQVESPMLGHYNVSNVLCAMALAAASGQTPSSMLEKLRRFPGVPGRTERVSVGQPFTVLVDYAHTDDALRNVLSMLRNITPGRILTVYGCGGNRDRSKRPKMTRAAMAGSDLIWATADNPRGESLDVIFQDMHAGVSDPARIAFIQDRRQAISTAINAARPGDTLLIAGKGHETYQEFADSVVPFDDRAIARELLLQKLNQRMS